MHKLYTLYSACLKNRRSLEKCAADVGAELLKIDRVLDVRWVASSFRAVNAVWNNYAALFAHFSSACTDSSLDSKERAQFKGLAVKISSSAFLLNLGLMYNALQELSDLSESLQAESLNLPKAHRLTVRQVEVFCSRKSDVGVHYQMASEAVTDGYFKGVDIQNQNTSRTDKLINRCQFYQALVDSLNCRLMPASEQTLIECVNVLFPSTWPAHLPSEYGEQELQQACTHFLVQLSGKLKDEYRDFKDCKGVAVNGPVLRKLLCAISTLPVSTAECERGFSRMNLICTKDLSQCCTYVLSPFYFDSLSTAGRMEPSHVR